MNSAIKIIGTLLFISILIPIIFFVCVNIWGIWNDEWSGFNASIAASDGYCNIAVIPILGEIHSYGKIYDNYGNELVSTNIEDTLLKLEIAQFDSQIIGIMPLIDSPGGTIVAAEIITQKLKEFPMPVASFIAESGTSAAYLIATGGDTIISSPFSDVGSIGVTMSYLDSTQQNQDLGLEFVSLSSAKYKDYMNPDKPLTTEERQLLERDLKIWHEELVRQIAENRGVDSADIEKYADGSSMPASLALEAKLIDSNGGLEAVKAWFAQELEMDQESIELCM